MSGTRQRLPETAGQSAALPRRCRLVAAAVLFVLTDLPTADAQQAEGERLFLQRCGACHAIDPARRTLGPHLAGVVGRAAGTIEGARYSAALRESGIVWDGATLDTFLAAPRRAVPGTTMTVSVPDAAQRAAIIAYLQSQ
jgi:cytochrome c